MIERILKSELLSLFVEHDCCENDICVSFDESIPRENYLIIKVDKYYNSLNIEFRPASVDCLIIRKCIETDFGLTLVELKDIQANKSFDLENLKAKFENTLNQFIKKDFREFLDVHYISAKLYFVSKKEIHRRDLGLKMELLINTRFKFNGKTLMIEPIMPTPTIKNCYSKNK